MVCFYGTNYYFLNRNLGLEVMRINICINVEFRASRQGLIADKRLGEREGEGEIEKMISFIKILFNTFFCLGGKIVRKDRKKSS